MVTWNYTRYNDFQNLSDRSKVVTSSYKFIPKGICKCNNTYFNTYRYPYIYDQLDIFQKPIQYINDIVDGDNQETDTFNVLDEVSDNRITLDDPRNLRLSQQYNQRQYGGNLQKRR